MPRRPRDLRPQESARSFFGSELRHWRQQRGHTQAELGQLVLHSGDLLAKVEKAVRWPSEQLTQRCDLVLDTGGALSRLLPLVLAERAGGDGDGPDRRVHAWLPPEDAATVKRPAEQDAVAKTLLDAAGSPRSGTVLLGGAGGIGKTTLALSVCRDPRLADAFDAMVWLETGQECGPARLLGLIGDVCERLDGERPALSSVDQAGFKLAESLAERRVLLVVDNVWTAGDLAPFLMGGPATVRLVTTRHLGVCPAPSAVMAVPPMSEAQLLQLIASRSPVPLNRAPALPDLAAACRGWPLLASLVGGTIARDIAAGASEEVAVDRAAAALREDGPEALDVGDGERESGTIGRVVRSSVDHLDGNVKLHGATDLAERYRELAIFPPAVPVPVSVLGTWWGDHHRWTTTAVRQFARVLAERSLLDAYDARTDTVLLHDVFRPCLTTITDRPAHETHRSLVDAFRAHATDGWHTLDPAHSYMWRHLVHHLENAGFEKEAVGLLADPAYVTAKISICGPDPFADDIEALDRMADHADPDAVAAAGALLRAVRLAPTGGSREDTAAALLVGLARAGLLDSPQAAQLRARSSVDVRWSLSNGDEGDGHTGAVTCVATAANRIASCGEDGSVRIWDSGSGRLLRVLHGHRGWVYSVALSVTADLVVSAGDDTTIRLWRVTTGEPVGVLNGHTKRIRGLALSGGGDRLVSVSEDGTAIVWSVDRLARLHAVATDGVPLWSVALDSTSTHVAIGGQDDTVRLYDLDGGDLVADSAAGHTDWVRALAFAPDAPLLASGSGDGAVALWSTTHDSLTLLRRSPTGQRVRSLVVSGGAGNIHAAGDAATVHAITAAGVRTTAKMPDGVDWIRSVVHGSDSETELVLGCEDGAIRIVSNAEVSDGTSRAPLEFAPGQGTVWSTAFDRTGELAAFGSHDGEVRFRRFADPDAGDGVAIPGGTGRIWSLSCEGDKVAAACGDGAIRVWNGLVGGRSLPTHTFTRDAGRAWSVDLSPDGELLAGSFGSGELCVWRVDDAELVWQVQAHHGRMRSLVFDTSGLRIVTGGGDGATRTWDSMSGELAGERHGATAGWVRAVAVNAAGELAASGFGSGDLAVGPVDGTGRTAHLFGHSGRVLALAFLADGRLASAAADGTVRVWSTTATRQLLEIRVDSSLQCAAIHAATGRVLASSSSGVVALDIAQP